MKLLIDIREKELINLIPELLKINNLEYEYEIKQLELGDIIICNPKTNEDEIIIERKSINDLASSIRDGRYAEQSLRLDSLDINNHNIIYLLEGQIKNYNSRYSKINSGTLYSSMISINYYKGFSVLRSFSINETAEIIIRMLDKISREYKKGKTPYYKNDVSEKNVSQTNPKDIKLDLELAKDIVNPVKEEIHYSSVIKKVKKDNITPKNIGEIILSQIPGISSIISIAIMKEFGSIYDLIMKLKENNKLLDNFSYINSKGQRRKISNKVINNINNFLLYKSEEEDDENKDHEIKIE
jgi:ERCC4-type nuclease